MKYARDEKENLKALMNMFVAINKLSESYSFEQAIDILDGYFKTNDEKYLTTFGGIREFVVKSNMREKILPMIDGKYKHLEDFIVDLSSTNKKSR